MVQVILKAVLCGFLFFMFTAGSIDSGYAQVNSEADETEHLRELKEVDPHTRKNAAESLGIIGGAHAVNDLIEALDDDVPAVREAAAGALGNIRDPRAVDALMEKLYDERFSVQAAACEALAQIGDRRAAIALREVVRQGNLELVPTAEAGLRGMGISVNPDNIEWELNEYIPKLSDPDPAVRADTVAALGALRITDPRSYDALMGALQDEDDSVRGAAITALGWLEESEATDALIALLNDENWEIKQAARQALLQIGGEKAEQAVREADARGALEPEPLPESEDPLAEYGEYEPTEFQASDMETLDAATYNLFKAFEEIGHMMEEVKFETEKHKSAFKTSLFMAKYYVQFAAAPEDELGRSIMRLSESGELNDYPEWLTHNLASISDIPFGGDVLPGMSINNGSLMHVSDTEWKLSQALEFFKRNSDYYTDNPPVREMQHLRELMSKFRTTRISYHNDLHEYLINVAKWTVLKRFWATVHYEERKRQVEAKYAGREESPIKQAKYEVEMREVDRWRDDILEEAERCYRNFNKAWDAAWKWKDVKFPATLHDEFGPMLELTKLNQSYIEKSERLKAIDRGSDEAKRLKDEIASLKTQIEQRISGQEKSLGSGWKERYRDPKTDQLPGGMLKDSALSRFGFGKKKTSQPPSQAQREELKEDQFYTFLGLSEPSNRELVPGGTLVTISGEEN